MKAAKTFGGWKAEKLYRRNTTTTVKQSAPAPAAPAVAKPPKRKNTLPQPIILPEEFNEKTEDEDEFSDDVSITPPILSVAESDDLLKMTIKEIDRRLQEKFELKADTDLRDAIQLDYYVAAVYWGKQEHFTAQQLTDFFTLVYTMILKVIEEHSSIVEVIKELHIMINTSGKESKSHDKSMHCFNKNERKAIIAYLYSSLFQHLKLYHYVFSRNQTEEIITQELSVELPLPAETPFPPGLYEGMPEGVMSEYLLLATPCSEAVDLDITRASSEVEVPSELLNIFAKLTPQDVKRIINETSATVLNSIQTEFENKIKTQEAAVVGKITKIRGDVSSNTALH